MKQEDFVMQARNISFLNFELKFVLHVKYQRRARKDFANFFSILRAISR